MEVVLSEIMMSTHEQESIICVSATGKLSEVIVGQISLAFSCRVVIRADTLLFQPLFRGLLIDLQLPIPHYIRALVGIIQRYLSTLFLAVVTELVYPELRLLGNYLHFAET